MVYTPRRASSADPPVIERGDGDGRPRGVAGAFSACIRIRWRWVRGHIRFLTYCLFVAGAVPDALLARNSSTSEVERYAAPSICDKFSVPLPSFWSIHGSEIKDAAVRNATWWPDQQRESTEFHHWLDELFENHYQVDQMRNSSIHPPDLGDALKVLEIISNRVDYLQAGGDYYPPLHILVTGGSLTAGMNCGENHLGLSKPGWMREYRLCAWPSRLEFVFNHVLFGGANVVKVSNLAVGGANSEVGKVLLEYQLFPESMRDELPHVIIWAHSANDSEEKDKGIVYREHLPGYVHAAHKLRICDDNLPLVVMVEEFYAASETNDVLGMICNVSGWFGLMGVSHRNIINQKVLANLDKPQVLN